MLTDAALRRAKGLPKQYKLSDALGLYILVKPNGSRLWRFKYRIAGSEKLLSLGAYPEVSLAEACQLRDEARAEVRNGRDPAILRRQKRSATDGTGLFRNLAVAWLEHNSDLWTERHKNAIESSLVEFVYPALGHIHARDITAPMWLDALRRAEKRVSPDKAKRIRQRISAVYRYGIVCGIVEFDPADQSKRALKPSSKNKQPAIINLDELKELLRTVEAFPAHPVVKLAFRFLALTACRSAKVRGALWSEIDGNWWEIPAERMKMSRAHAVPLST